MLGGTAQKMKFYIKDFFSKCDQIAVSTCTEEILNGKFYFLCSVGNSSAAFLYFIKKVSLWTLLFDISSYRAGSSPKPYNKFAAFLNVFFLIFVVSWQ